MLRPFRRRQPFLRQTKGTLKSEIPFYIGGEECFCSREWTPPPLQGNFGALDRCALEEADVTVTFVEGPAIVAELQTSSTTRGFGDSRQDRRVLGIGLIR
jgi:hypothetical protein